MRLREVRKRFLNPAMLGEPAFDVLLALYVATPSRRPSAVRDLSSLVGFPESTIARWVKFLVDEGLVLCTNVEAGDPGPIAAVLTEKGRKALDGYLGSFDLVD